MELASFFAPSLKTVDSLIQVGRDSFKLDPGVALDLHFRVVTVRLWATSSQFCGVQFTYRHAITGEEREGVQLETADSVIASLSPLEIKLIDEEFIAQAHARTTSKDASVVSTVVLITSTGRRFQVGASTIDSSETFPNPYTEIRELRGHLSPSRDLFASVTPVTMLQPNADAIQALVNEAVETATTKWWYPDRCEKLANKLREVGEAVHGVVARGIVYPVGLLCELAEVAQLSKAVVASCGQALSVDYLVPRGIVIDGYISRLAAIMRSCDDRFPKAELASLDVGDPVDILDTHSVPRMVRQALKSSQNAIATTLCCKYAQYLVEDEALVHRMVETLVETDDSGRIVHVVDAYSQASNKSIAGVMARYKTRQPALTERAIYKGEPVLLEWLVREVHLDPFDSVTAKSIDSSEGEKTLAEVSATRHAQRQAQSKALFELVDGVQDKKSQQRMLALLTHIKKKDDFEHGLVTLASDDHVSAHKFQALVPHITSVYDLPLLFSQATASLGDDQRGLSVLVKAACDHILDHKLVMDTRASAFFNIALRQASEHGFLSALEHEHYRILNSQVNMESATWVVELKRTTDHMHWRVSRLDDQVESLQRNVRDLRDSLRRNEEIELNRRKCRRNLALLSSMLVVVGGGTAVYALQDMFEPVDPTQLIKTSEDDFLDGVKSTASGLLGGSDDATALVNRFTGSSDAASLVSRVTSAFGNQSARASEGIAGLDILSNLGIGNNKTTEILGVLSTAAELCTLPKSSVQQKSVSFDEKKIRLHPYHDAVRASRGDLHQFLAIEKTLGPNADVNDDFDVTVSKVHDDGKTTTTTTRMAAYILASHLGYVDIVDYFLANKNLRKREWKVTTKRRARKALNTGTKEARRLSTTTTGPP